MRAPRRTFATPFVVTAIRTAGAGVATAAFAACAGAPPRCDDCGPRERPFATADAHPIDAAAPDAAPDAMPDATPAVPTQATWPTKTRPLGVDSFAPDHGPGATIWELHRYGERCWVTLRPPPCPRPSRCNPPPPQDGTYGCPEDVAFDRPLIIVLPSGSGECTVQVHPAECVAADARCPAPRAIACPE